ncbi:MAG: NAD(P)/FAD-dependent oxidoreductase, partial [Acidobacteriota bacterium]
MPTGAPNCDVAIIGGGPAGSGTAAYLARAGLNCIVFERELFPRLHVGESLVPSSTRVFKELDFLEQMEENRFPHKHGAVWTSGSRSRMYHHDWEGLETDCQAAVRFEERAQPGVDRNYTYHVDRARFDLLLLQHACKSGAKVYEGIQVSRVEFSENDFPRLRFSLGRKRVGLTARMVVDASGRRTILGNQLRLRVHDPVFDQYALHTWFEGYDRSVLAAQPEMKDYIFI